jgi:hypothetical protein
MDPSGVFAGRRCVAACGRNPVPTRLTARVYPAPMSAVDSQTTRPYVIPPAHARAMSLDGAASSTKRSYARGLFDPGATALQNSPVPRTRVRV